MGQKKKGPMALGLDPSKTKIKYVNGNKNKNKVNTRLKYDIIMIEEN